MELSCIIIDDEPHAISELKDLISATPGMVLLNSFRSITPAVAFLRERKNVDIIFSDISMPAINGIDAGNLLNSHCDFLIYVTAHKNFALEAYEVDAAGYLLKPVSSTTFLQQLEKIYRKKERVSVGLKDIRDFAFLKGGNKNNFTKIKLTDIVCVCAMLNYVLIHSIRGKEITYTSLKRVEDKLKDTGLFIRISRSVIVSINYIDKVDGNIVLLTDKQSFPIGMKYRSDFHKFLREHTLL